MIFTCAVSNGVIGLYASIFAKGVSQSDNVTLITPSGKMQGGKWTTKDSTDGFLFDKLGESGVYKITAIRATDGKTDFKEIYIDAAIEYEVYGFYVFYLYKTGDECENVTGGWSATQSTITKADSYIQINTSNSSLGTILHTNRLVDLSKYKKIYALVDIYANRSTGSAMSFFTGPDTSDENRTNETTFKNPTVAKETKVLELQNIGTYMVSIGVYMLGIKLHQLWAE